MSNKVLLLVIAIGAILIGTSGKGLLLWKVITSNNLSFLKGKGDGSGTPDESNPTDFDPSKGDFSGGVGA